jgi:hypothetical protein
MGGIGGGFPQRKDAAGMPEGMKTRLGDTDKHALNAAYSSESTATIFHIL